MMKNAIFLISLFVLFILSACAEFSQTTQKAFTGLSIKSANMSDEEIEEEAHGGQMRNIK